MVSDVSRFHPSWLPIKQIIGIKRCKTQLFLLKPHFLGLKPSSGAVVPGASIKKGVMLRLLLNRFNLDFVLFFFRRNLRCFCASGPLSLPFFTGVTIQDVLRIGETTDLITRAISPLTRHIFYKKDRYYLEYSALELFSRHLAPETCLMGSGRAARNNKI